MASTMRFGEVVVDLDRGVCRQGSGQAVMTPKEVELLRYLGEHPHEDLPRNRIQSELWGYHPHTQSRALDTVVKRLRARIEPGDRPRYLRTVRGVGYRFEPPPQSRPTLPRPRTRFVGRAALLAELTDRDDAFVTLAGPGGSGKTRLALEVAAATVLDGGVWFCDCTQARTVRDVATQVAAVLGIGVFDASLAEPEQVARALAERGALLLVLDNLEQVEPALAEVLSRWVEASPELRILATSRRLLHVRGERAVWLGRLDPDDAADLLADRVTHAAGVAPDLDDPDVVSLLAQLDGLPLAIELAAGRLATLDAGRVREELGAYRDARTRHASIDAALRWGWDLLGAWERDALVQLASFPSSWTSDGAAAVLWLEHPDSPARIGAVLQRLAEQSWVEVRRTSGVRYGFLVPVRAFITEQGAAPDARTRMATWAAALGHDEALRHLRGDGARRASQTLHAERDTLLAGLEDALSREDGASATRCCLAAVASLRAVGGLREAGELVARVGRLPSLHAHDRVRLHRERVALAVYAGPPDAALLAEGRRLAAEAEPAVRARVALDGLEWAVLYEQHIDLSALDAIEATLTAAGDDHGVLRVAVQRFRHHCRHTSGDVEVVFQAALRRARALGDLRYDADLHTWYGIRLALVGRRSEARRILRRSQELEARLGGLHLTMSSRLAAAYQAWTEQDLARALHLNQDATDYAEARGVLGMGAVLRLMRAGILEELGRFDEAFDVAHPVAMLLAGSTAGERASLLLARTLWQRGELRAARARLGALSPRTRRTADARFLEAALALDSGDAPRAATLAEASLGPDHAAHDDVHLARRRALAAEAAAWAGQLDRAATRLAEAEAEVDETLSPRHRHEVHARLAAARHHLGRPYVLPDAEAPSATARAVSRLRTTAALRPQPGAPAPPSGGRSTS